MLPPESFHATSLPSWKKRNLAWEVHNNNHPFPNNPSSRIGSPFTTLPWHLNRFKPPGEHYRTQSTKYNTHTHTLYMHIYIYIHNVCPSHHQMIPRHGGPTSLWPNFSSCPFWSPGSWVRSGGCRVILPQPSKMANSSEWFTFEETKIDIDWPRAHWFLKILTIHCFYCLVDRPYQNDWLQVKSLYKLVGPISWDCDYCTAHRRGKMFLIELAIQSKKTTRLDVSHDGHDKSVT